MQFWDKMGDQNAEGSRKHDQQVRKGRRKKGKAAGASRVGRVRTTLVMFATDRLRLSVDWKPTCCPSVLATNAHGSDSGAPGCSSGGEARAHASRGGTRTKMWTCQRCEWSTH